MRAYEISEGFRDWFKKKKPIGPQPMNHADIEMIQSVDGLARNNTEEVYNLQSRYGKYRIVYVKYPNAYQFRVILPNGNAKSFKFTTASELHKIFYSLMNILEKKNGT